MFYIQKNDKPNCIEKTFNIIKMQENKLFLPITANTSEKQIEKLAQKTKKIISKYSNSKKIVISKNLQEEITYINYLNSYGLDISDGRWLYEILATDIIKYIIEKKKIKKEETTISILINDLTEIELENIKILAENYKNLNIVTNHIEKFKKLEDKFMENGIMITIGNNKKKSLMKSKIILNIDFPNELINKYMIKEDAIIINVPGKVKINRKRFNGLIVNNYEIDFRDDIKSEENLMGYEFYLRDVYESRLYKKQTFSDIRNALKKDGVRVKSVCLSNSVL
ncbi:hypothetical protein EGR52_06775 [bacterium]|nr:hypothetical protein [bacterium]